MPIRGEVVERGLDLDGLPEHDDVDPQAKGAKLVLLTSLIVLT